MTAVKTLILIKKETIFIYSSLIPVIKHRHFQDAINSLNKFKETCCPGEMMDHINEAFKFIDSANNEQGLFFDNKNGLEAIFCVWTILNLT